MNWELLQSTGFAKIIASAILVAGALAVRTLLIRAILRNAPKSEIRRRWVVGVRNATVFLVLIGLVAVWFEAIESFGAAVLAFAVALVIATREIIQCILGAFVRTVADTYSIGDRIEVGEYRGDVIDLNLLATTILEVGPGRQSHLRTGRTVVIPNSRLLDTMVVNESNMHQYIVHCFVVPVLLEDDWKRAEEVLMRAAEIECASFIDDARIHMAELERSHGLTGLYLKPRVSVEIPEPGKINLLVRVPARVGMQGRLEQAILRRYLEETGKPSTGARRQERDIESPAPESLGAARDSR